MGQTTLPLNKRQHLKIKLRKRKKRKLLLLLVKKTTMGLKLMKKITLL
jgi:hypothetical protein